MRLLEKKRFPNYSRAKNTFIKKPLCHSLPKWLGSSPPHFLKKYVKEKKKERRRKKISDLPKSQIKYKKCSSDCNEMPKTPKRPGALPP